MNPVSTKWKLNLPGFNQLDLFVLDEATIETLPNGDPRPLLVQLTRIEIRQSMIDFPTYLNCNAHFEPGGVY